MLHIGVPTLSLVILLPLLEATFSNLFLQILPEFYGIYSTPYIQPCFLYELCVLVPSKRFNKKIDN